MRITWSETVEPQICHGYFGRMQNLQKIWWASVPIFTSKDFKRNSLKIAFVGEAHPKKNSGLVKVKQAHLNFLRCFFLRITKMTIFLFHNFRTIFSIIFTPKKQRFLQVFWGLLLFWVLKIGCEHDFLE